MSEMEKELMDLLDNIEMVSDDMAVLELTSCRFDIAEEHGYEVTFDPEPLSIH